MAGAVAGSGGVARATGTRSWRWLDVVLGVGTGLALRAVIELMHPTSGSFERVEVTAVVAFVVVAVVVSPTVEELFFRGLVVRALADALAGAGAVIASTAAILCSTAAFVGLHVAAFGDDVPVSLIIGTSLVGVGCGVLTLLTGRLGAALAAHAVYNLGGVVLLLA